MDVDVYVYVYVDVNVGVDYILIWSDPNVCAVFSCLFIVLEEFYAFYTTAMSFIDEVPL